MHVEDKGNILAICAVALCVMITLGLCLALSGQGFIGAILFEGVQKDSVYLVCAGPYEDIILARNTAELVASRGGAGYMMGDGSFELVYAAYSNEEDAQGVASALGSGAYVKRIELKKSKLKWAQKDEKQAILAALEYYGVAFSTLYECANKLNTNEVTIEDVKIKIGVLRQQIEDIKRDFDKKSGDNGDARIVEIKVAIITALALVDNLELGKTSAKAMSSLRYAAVQLVLLRQALMEKI